jgi:hypothetical protein
MWHGRSRAVAAVVLAAGMLAACTAGSDSAGSSTAASAAPKPSVANDLATNSAHHTLPVAGEGFDLAIDYWTTTDATAWQSTAAHDINLTLHLALHPGAPAQTVLIASTTISDELLSTQPQLDALQLSSTTDSANALPGYLVSDVYPYEDSTTIPAMAGPLLARWSSFSKGAQLTSAALSSHGVYANRISFQFDVLVQNPGDATYHKRTLSDVLTVPSDK